MKEEFVEVEEQGREEPPVVLGGDSGRWDLSWLVFGSLHPSSEQDSLPLPPQHCLSLCLSVTGLGSGMEALCPRGRQGRKGSAGNRLKGVVPMSDLGLELWPPYPSSQ